jgi:hypothetical protein
VRANTDCSNNIRYSLSDADGKLRFVEFEACGSLKGTKVEKVLASYLKNRSLSDISFEEVVHDNHLKDDGCMKSIFNDLIELRKLFV